MSYRTLHHYNFDVVSAVDTYVHLIGQNDAVIIYANRLNLLQYQHIIDQLTIKQVFFIIELNDTNLKVISYSQLLELTTNYEHNFTWK